MTTFGEYQHAVDVAMRERFGLRRGQASFNVWVDLEPEIAQRLAETGDDPCYNDDRLPGS
jgi:hypothetical protein